jgi:hypothetical protein
MNNQIHSTQEFAGVNTSTPHKIRTYSECRKIGSFIEPCAIAPSADLDTPQHPKDWETPENIEPLWEQELHRTNGGDSRSIAWLSLYYGCDGTREDHNDNAPCRFVVALNDLLTRNQCTDRDGCWHHDITSTLLGQDIVRSWIALNPEKHAALPTNYKEWRERSRRSAYESIASDVRESGIDITDMSEEEVYICWKKNWRQERLAELEVQGWSPEEIAQKMKEEFGEQQM